MLSLDADAVHRLLDFSKLVEALRMAHRSGVIPETRAQVMEEPGKESNKFVALLAWSRGDVIAVKLVGVFPDNTMLIPPQPSVQGQVLLFSAVTGRPILAADGAAMTYRKTAADSALGADILARRNAEVLLILGAGGLAPHMIAAHRAVRPSIKRILVWNHNTERAKSLAETLNRNSCVRVEVVGKLDDVVPEADIISSVTMARAPLLKGALLKAGAHVDLVGAFMPDMREADDDVLRRAGKLFVDTFIDCEGSGDVIGPLKQLVIAREDIIADLFDLCGGRHPGRTSDDQITVFKNVGGGHLDLFVARHLRDAVLTDPDAEDAIS